MSTKTISPLDVIILTDEVLTTITYLYKDGKIKYSRFVILPEGTHLKSAEINYKTNDEQLFYFEDVYQYYLFKNTNMANEIKDKSVIGFRLCIKLISLKNRFEIARKFEYRQLNPKNHQHIMLVTVIFLSDGFKGLDVSKWLLFSDNLYELAKIRVRYKEGLICYNDAKSQIFKRITEQIKIRNN